MEQNNEQVHGTQQAGQIKMAGSSRTNGRLFTILFALIPGAGQMYHGLFKKGISIMAIFFGTIIISQTIYFEPILLILPIIWFYSFFDTTNRINTPIDEIKLIKDSFLFQVEIPENRTISTLLKRRHIWFGWGLTIVGVYAILNSLSEGVLNFLSEFIDRDVIYRIRDLISTIPTFIIPIICIVLGIRLLKNTSPTPSNEITEDLCEMGDDE